MFFFHYLLDAMGNTDLDELVQVVKQNASLPDLIGDALRKNSEIPTFVIDVSNIIHAQLHAHAMDLVLRNSWKGFEQVGFNFCYYLIPWLKFCLVLKWRLQFNIEFNK